jgi:hypothetical protein
MAGETEVLGENLPRRHFVHYKFPAGCRSGKPATNRFSYGAAKRLPFDQYILPRLLNILSTFTHDS